jgi:peroxisomal 3,2-trans-enoyl-CoA isomerase
MESIENLDVFQENGILTIKLNNIRRKNSITIKIFRKIMAMFEKAKTDENIKVVYFSSTGDFFSSGSDFNNFNEGSMDELIQMFESFINALIEFPKVLIAGVNGVAVGVSFSMLAMFDIVLCSDTAFFQVPFIQTFQTPEACSSYLFPIMFGKSMAGHLLLNGGPMTAEEAKNLGFVAKIFSNDSFENDAYEYVKGVAKYPLRMLNKIKSMINKHSIDHLKKVNKEECVELRESWNQKEFENTIAKFAKKFKKAKF